LIMDYMDNRYKSCDYGRFFGFKITTSKKQKVLFDYANTTPACIHKNTPPSRTHLQLDMFGWEINTQLLLGNIPMIAVCFHLKTLFEGNTTFGGHWGIQQGH